MTYTYAPHEPELYGGKAFLVTPETGSPFMVVTATGESEVPALVDFHLNPPAPAPYPDPTPPPPPTADQRLDAGIDAAIGAADAVRDAIHTIPANFTAANFQAFLTQAKALSDAFVAMLEAQRGPPPT